MQSLCGDQVGNVFELLSVRMVWIFQTKNATAGKLQHLITNWKDSGYRNLKLRGNLLFDIDWIVGSQNLIHHQKRLWRIQLPRYLQCHRCPLKVLAIGAQQEYQDI